MDTFSSSPAGWKSMLQELTSRSPSGKKYSRNSAVDDEIQGILRLHQSEWILEAPNLKNETLVFLMHLVRRADEQLFYKFFQELCARIARLARRGISRYCIDNTVVQEIVEEVESKVLELVLAETPTRQTEVLEFA